MQRITKVLLGLLALSAFACYSAVTIDPGVVKLATETADQTISINASGSGTSSGMNLFLQVGNGTSGPTISSVDMVNGTIWGTTADNQVELGGSDNRTVFHASVTPFGTVSVAGTVAKITVSTVGVSAGKHPISLVYKTYASQILNEQGAPLELSLVDGFLSIPYLLIYSAGEGGSVTGTASQYVHEGEDADSVTATSNIGYEFVKWSDGNLNATRTDVKVSANLNVTAEFKKSLFTLTVNEGTGSGDYEMGTVIDVSANPPPSGKIFDKWTGNIENLADVKSASTTFTMPAKKAEITATYKSSYALTVIKGSGDGLYSFGEIVSISADPAESEQAFWKWAGDTQYINDIYSSVTTVTMPSADISVEAKYRKIKYTLIVNSGKSIAPGPFSPGEETTIIANTPSASAKQSSEYASSLQFYCWTVSGNATILDEKAPTTKITINGDCIATANYISSQGMIVVTYPNGFESLYAGAPVTIKWASSNAGDKVKIDLFNSGVLVKTIIEDTENDGSLEWLIPEDQKSGAEYKILVASLSSVTAKDTSDANFSIHEPKKANLKLAIEPDESYGITHPDAGIITEVQCGAIIPISAVPAENFKFLRWEADKNVKILNKTANETFVILSGDSEITAQFILDYEISDFGKISIKMDETKANADTLSIAKAQLPAGITPDDFKDLANFEFTIVIDGYKSVMNQTTGVLKKMGKKNIFSYKANKGKDALALVISLEQGKRVWSLKGSKLAMSNKVDTDDGVDILLKIGKKLFGDTLDLDETIQWTYEAAKGDKADSLYPDKNTGFSIASANGKAMNFMENSDSFTIKKAVPGKMEFSTEDMLILTIDEWSEVFDGFKGSGEKKVFKWAGDILDGGKATVVLDLEKSLWSFKINKADALSDLISAKDGVEVRFQTGSFEDGLKLYMDQKRVLKYPQKNQ